MVRPHLSSLVRWERFPFIGLAVLSLLAGLVAGLQRLGWHLPVTVLAPGHGSIMVGGFLGSLMALEKIIPLKRPSLFLIPALSGASLFFFVTEFHAAGWMCLVISSIGLTSVFAFYWQRDRSVINALPVIGSACWLVGNIVLLLTGSHPMAVSWWMAFTLLVIVSERLELSRFLPVGTLAKGLLVCVLIGFVASCILSFHGAGSYIASFALVVTGAWLLRYDLIGLNIRRAGLPKFVSIALLTGYTTLMLTGCLLAGASSHGFGYDMVVHCFFIGFVFSMIFAHGPIILPGVLGIPARPYHRVLYVWLVALHASWALRLTGDLLYMPDLRKVSGLASVLAIAGYFMSLALLTTRIVRSQANRLSHLH